MLVPVERREWKTRIGIGDFRAAVMIAGICRIFRPNPPAAMPVAIGPEILA